MTSQSNASLTDSIVAVMKGTATKPDVPDMHHHHDAAGGDDAATTGATETADDVMVTGADTSLTTGGLFF